jgi:hypothetical protein
MYYTGAHLLNVAILQVSIFSNTGDYKRLFASFGVK